MAEFKDFEDAVAASSLGTPEARADQERGRRWREQHEHAELPLLLVDKPLWPALVATLWVERGLLVKHLDEVGIYLDVRPNPEVTNLARLIGEAVPIPADGSPGARRLVLRHVTVGELVPGWLAGTGWVLDSVCDPESVFRTVPDGWPRVDRSRPLRQRVLDIVLGRR